MGKLTTAAIGAVCLVAGAGSATLYAQATAPVYTVYEAHITDEAAYTKALPEVEKYIKENDGTRVAGGFNKAKLISGTEKLGNRYVIVRWANAAASIRLWMPASRRGLISMGMALDRLWSRASRRNN